MERTKRHALIALAVGLALAPAAAGCGKEKEKGGASSPPASSGRPTDVPGRPAQGVPGIAADGVNDDQGGSVPGNRPSSQAP
jgi:hypothetical protein